MTTRVGAGVQVEACRAPECEPSTRRPMFFRDDCRGCLTALVAMALQPEPAEGLGSNQIEGRAMGGSTAAQAALIRVRAKLDEFDPLRVRAEPLLLERASPIG